ncbi:MAG: hypothetical protein PHO48_00085 [Candidatus Gracilibacteria bacterium]|nr:hypothetical protein [Candidatus Gracilibacteria bacterium]MDD5178668.1 hypothetical protein [Candidatus Gracilibacteria bacterium]
MSETFSPKRENTTPGVIEKLHEDLKKWQKSNTIVSIAMILLTVMMIALVVFQIYMAEKLCV